MRRETVEQPLDEDRFTGPWPDKIIFHLSREDTFSSHAEREPHYSKQDNLGPGMRQRRARKGGQ